MEFSLKKGFTVLELIIVIAIVGVLAAVVVPRFMASRSQGATKALSTSNNKASHKADRQTINAQLELFYFQNNEYPVSGNLSEWTVDVNTYFPEGLQGTCNAGVPWVIHNGRVDMSMHANHE